MAEHPAAPLLARDLGRLQHTNARGEVGIVTLPGFATAAGMSDDQAEQTGALALAIAEGIIETLDQRHGWELVTKAELKTLRRRATQSTGPAEAPISTCKRCGQPILQPGPTIDVATMVRVGMAHLEVCR